MQSLDDVEIIFYDSKIYVPQSLRKHVIDWYHLYLNHSGGSTLAKRIRGLCYWKGVVAQADLYAKTCKICEQFKNIKNIYGHMPPKNIAELKPWDLVHVDLISPYSKYIIQQQPGGAIIRNNVSLTFMAMIDSYMPGLSSCLTTHSFVDTRVHTKLCLRTDLSLNETSLLC